MFNRRQYARGGHKAYRTGHDTLSIARQATCHLRHAASKEAPEMDIDLSKELEDFDLLKQKIFEAVGRDQEMVDLTMTGYKIRFAIQILTGEIEDDDLWKLLPALLGDGITAEELDKFVEYCDHQSATMPLMDPTLYMRGGGDAVELARKHARALRAFWAIYKEA